MPLSSSRGTRASAIPTPSPASRRRRGSSDTGKSTTPAKVDFASVEPPQAAAQAAATAPLPAAAVSPDRPQFVPSPEPSMPGSPVDHRMVSRACPVLRPLPLGRNPCYGNLPFSFRSLNRFSRRRVSHRTAPRRAAISCPRRPQSGRPTWPSTPWIRGCNPMAAPLPTPPQPTTRHLPSGGPQPRPRPTTGRGTRRQGP